MAIGAAVDYLDALRGNIPTFAGEVRPASQQGDWLTVIDVGGMDDADNGGSRITDPVSQIILATRHPIKVPPNVTLLVLSMVYDDAAAAVTDDAVVNVFGRKALSANAAAGRFKRCTNPDGDVDITLTADPTGDVTDGTLKDTRIHPREHVLDVYGAEEVWIGVMTALNTDGNDALALLQAKFI